MNTTSYNNMQKSATRMGVSPVRTVSNGLGAGSGPGGSGPIENDDELVCDILTEMISALFKIFSRLIAKHSKIIAQLNAQAPRAAQQSQET